MPIRTREVSNATILDIEGNVDINSSEIVETTGCLINSGKLNLLLNFENVDLVDYNGLSVLTIAYKNALNHNGIIKFFGIGLAPMELFRLVKLDTVFEIYPNEEEAIASLSESAIDRLTLRRKFKRLDIHLNVDYRIEGDQKEPKIFKGGILNISGVGVYIYTRDTFPINSPLILEFKLPGSSAGFELSGRVVWLADKQIQPHIWPGMGAAFTHLTPEKEEAIIDFIDKNITHRSNQE